MSRLIDAYTEGYVEKSEFESRIGGLRERRQALEQQQQQLDEAVLSKADLRLIIGRLEDFAAKVDVGLAEMDFEKQRDLIRTLVKRVEIDNEQVNVVFRVESIPRSNSLSDCGNGGPVFRGGVP
jgi:site-specific DNA recombinase